MLARSSFEKSIEILEPIDSFQAAISRFEYGKFQLAMGNLAKARQLGQVAHKEFSQFKESPEYAQSKSWLAESSLHNP